MKRTIVLFLLALALAAGCSKEDPVSYTGGGTTTITHTKPYDYTIPILTKDNVDRYCYFGVHYKIDGIAGYSDITTGTMDGCLYFPSDYLQSLPEVYFETWGLPDSSLVSDTFKIYFSPQRVYYNTIDSVRVIDYYMIDITNYIDTIWVKVDSVHVIN